MNIRIVLCRFFVSLVCFLLLRKKEIFAIFAHSFCLSYLMKLVLQCHALVVLVEQAQTTGQQVLPQLKIFAFYSCNLSSDFR
jgi:hypothetical protein